MDLRIFSGREQLLLFSWQSLDSYIMRAEREMGGLEVSKWGRSVLPAGGHGRPVPGSFERSLSHSSLGVWPRCARAGVGGGWLGVGARRNEDRPQPITRAISRTSSFHPLHVHVPRERPSQPSLSLLVTPVTPLTPPHRHHRHVVPQLTSHLSLKTRAMLQKKASQLEKLGP